MLGVHEWTALRGHCRNQGRKAVQGSLISPTCHNFVFVCVQHLIISPSAPTGARTIDLEHMSVGLIAAYLRLLKTNNWHQITSYLKASGCCRSDALHACLPLIHSVCVCVRVCARTCENRSRALWSTHQIRDTCLALNKSRASKDWFKPRVHFLCGNERLQQIYFCCLERRERLIKAPLSRGEPVGKLTGEVVKFPYSTVSGRQIRSSVCSQKTILCDCRRPGLMYVQLFQSW